MAGQILGLYRWSNILGMKLFDIVISTWLDIPPNPHLDSLIERNDGWE